MRGELASVVTVYQQVSPDAWTVFDVNPGIGLNGLDVADVNADGRADIVVGGVWMENPGGNLAASAWPAHSFAPGWNAYAAVKVIDMDGDGRNDIVLSVSDPLATSPGSRRLWILGPDLGRRTSSTPDSTRCTLLRWSISIRMPARCGGLGVRGAGRLIIYLRSGSNWWPTSWGRDALHNMRSGDIDSDGDVDLFGATAFG